MRYRDEFGALWADHQDPFRPLIDTARAMAAEAASKGKIPVAFDGMTWERISSRVGNKRIGDALRHEVYDLTPDGRKALVCARAVEGTRYGIKTISKTYFLIARHGRGLRVAEASKAIAAKAAKQCGDGLGLAIDILEGRARLSAPFSAWRQGFKAVTRDQDGDLVSVWDGSRWDIGKTRSESATDSHEGGFYYYGTLDECRVAAERKEVFGDAREHDGLVFIEVEVSGREFVFADGKRCVTRVRPLRVIEEGLLVA